MNYSLSKLIQNKLLHIFNLAIYYLCNGVWCIKLKQVCHIFAVFNLLHLHVIQSSQQTEHDLDWISQSTNCLNIDGKKSSQGPCLRAHLMFLTPERTWLNNTPFYMTSHTCQLSNLPSDFKVVWPGHRSAVVKCLW